MSKLGTVWVAESVCYTAMFLSPLLEDKIGAGFGEKPMWELPEVTMRLTSMP